MFTIIAQFLAGTILILALSVAMLFVPGSWER